MKLLVIPVLFMSLFASTSVYANENYDLQCTLDNGDQMTVSHNDSTVYIEFLGPKDDPDEGGRVIKLDIPSGEVQQALNTSTVGAQSFVLRGTGEDIDGAVAISYEKYEGKRDASFSVMNSMGKETEYYTCRPDTIQTSTALLHKGISNVPMMH